MVKATGRDVSAKKSLPLSSTTTKAGKSSTSIFQTASMPSSAYSTTSTLLMQSCASHPGGRESHHLCRPDRAVAEYVVLDAGDALDGGLRQPRRRPADGAEVEAAEPLTGIGDLLAAVALGQHDEPAAGRLELRDVGVQ